MYVEVRQSIHRLSPIWNAQSQYNDWRLTYLYFEGRSKVHVQNSHAGPSSPEASERKPDDSRRWGEWVEGWSLGNHLKSCKVHTLLHFTSHLALI